MNSIPKKSYNGLDLFKFIMSILVVAIHTFPWDSFDNKLISIFEQITKTAVPFFFLASGYLLACKFSETYFDELNRKTVIIRLKQIIKMYLFWTVIYLPLGIYSYIDNGYSIPYSIAVTLRKIVFRGENFNSWMLWYLLSTIYALIFVWITMKLKFKPIYMVFTSVAMLYVDKFINYIAWCEQSLPAPLELLKTIIKYTITDGRILGGLIYLPLGIYLCTNQEITKYLQFSVIPCFILTNLINNSFAVTVLNLFLYVGIFCFALRLNLKDRFMYRVLRKSSTSIYFIHMYVYSAFCFIFYREIKCELPGFVFTVLVTVLISVVWSLYKSKKQVVIQK